MLQILAGSFLSGILFASGPCLLSCGPILFPYIAGTGKNMRSSMVLYLLFCSSRIVAYIVLGILVFFMGKLAAEHLVWGISKYILALGAVLVFSIGIFLIAGMKVRSAGLVKLKEYLLDRSKGNFILLGLVFGLLPCAPFWAFLAYIGLVSKSAFQNVLYVSAFGLGTLLSPLIIIVLFSGFIFNLFKDRVVLYQKAIRILSGLILIALSIDLVLRVLNQ